MTHLKTAFVVNPGSGGRRKNRLRSALMARISGLLPDSPIQFSASADEAAVMTRELLEKGYECIAAAGGDGTFNSVLQGFFSDDRGTPVRKGASLAVIPVGTGGDFRRSLGIENDPIAALSLLSGTSTRPCDVGRVEYMDFDGKKCVRYFLNITSFGLGGLVDKYVQESSRKLGGTLTFFMATVRAFRNYSNADVTVTLDDGFSMDTRSVVVAVANGKFFGGGMCIAPMAEISDGLLEVIILGDMHLWDFIKDGSKLYGGKLKEHPHMVHKSVRKVAIVPKNESQVMYMDMDGEPLGVAPASVEVIPSAINLKV
jgi:YegS/Rv2252/BmrU family lipid kinase